jgi:hypothetical protein
MLIGPLQSGKKKEKIGDLYSPEMWKSIPRFSG